jgi:NAD(P)-dependent dehydrogenase (short-subunit alcohol dehydrogenase family)
MPPPHPVALITAGSAGLGAAAARLFCSSGYRVIINYSNNEARATALVQELSGLSPLSQEPQTEAEAIKNPNVQAIRADLTKRDEIIRLVETATEMMGRLDVVFSNGGWTMIRNFNDLDDNVNEDDWDRCFNMNVKSHLWLMHAARKWLEESEGAFITTASLAGVRPSGSSLVCFLAFYTLSQIVEESVSFAEKQTNGNRHILLRKRRRYTS